MANDFLNALATAMGRVLFPPTCSGCGRILADQAAVCGACWPDIHFIDKPYCPVYGTPFSHDPGAGMVSARALAEPPDFDRARAAVLYGPLARKLVSGLKYQDRHQNADQMALWMKRACHDLLLEADAIVPVPLHWRRFMARRYNQSAVLAKSLAASADRPFRPQWLRRIKETLPQVGLNEKERAANLRAAFSVPEAMRASVAGKRILVVDDVFTTGATVNAAARALRKAGAAHVDVATFALVEEGSGNGP